MKALFIGLIALLYVIVFSSSVYYSIGDGETVTGSERERVFNLIKKDMRYAKTNKIEEDKQSN